MLQWLRKPDVAALLLRLALGSIFIMQGGLKVLYFDGGTTWYKGVDDYLPTAVQALVAWGELLCGFALVLGLLTRVASLALMVVMIGAIYMVTWRLDFTSLATQNPAGLMEPKVGYEYNYAILAMCASLTVLGAGVLSLDHLLWNRKRQAVSAAAEAPVAVGAKT